MTPLLWMLLLLIAIGLVWAVALAFNYGAHRNK